MSGTKAAPQLRPLQRVDLIEQLGRSLQQRFTYAEIDDFLSACGIKPPQDYGGTNSKRLYSKAALRDVSDAMLLKIASELEAPTSSGPPVITPPRNWQSISSFRLFISHISKDKDKATRLKECLAEFSVSGFVAHEDIHPTLEWQVEIERALQTMDAFIAIHTPGFSASIWTQQEIGFAVGRGTKIISLKMGEDPTGFISKQQALARRGRRAEDVAKEINQTLADDPRTAQRLAEAKKLAGGSMPDEIPF
jgi:hypothetical protein